MFVKQRLLWYLEFLKNLKSIHQVSKQCRDLISLLQIQNQRFKFEIVFLERLTNAYSIAMKTKMYILFLRDDDYMEI